MQNSICLPGMVQLPKRFLILKRRQRRLYLNDSTAEGVDKAVNTAEEPVLVQEKNRRGRKPKQQNYQQQEDRPQMGRPPLVGTALNDDSVPLRRSRRTKK